MKHDFILSIIYYICGYYYAVLGAYTGVANVKSRINRLFVFITSAMAIWSFSYSLSNSADTAELSAYWRCFSVFGWGVFFSLLLHFILLITKTEIRTSKRIALILLYLPSVINIILYAPFGILGTKQYEMAQTKFGWVNTLSFNTGRLWLNLYAVVFSILGVVLTLRWWRKLESHTLMKRQVGILLISLPLPMLSGVVTDMVPSILGKESLPKVTIILLIIPVSMLFIASRKYGVFLERRKTTLVLRKADGLLDSDRMRLFQLAAAIFVAGAGLSFLIRYFGLKGEFINEFLLAGTLLASGIVVRSIPLITKQKTKQNTLFMLFSVLAMIFLTIINAETGATTIWAIYILFLLFTVILDSIVHAYIFAISSIVVQIIFWIDHPKILVTIDGNEYITRIFVIALSFITVRYLTSEYASKIEGYQRFAKEQEVLEKISSSFISINSENAREKVDEMLEMADEILDYSHAYLLEFCENNEDALILNMRVKDVERETYPYYPGMKVKMATLPMVKCLIADDMPVMCEDVSNISIDEPREQRDFFMSRGIHSYFALPVKVDEEIKGMLVIEYYDRTDISFRESRLNFLKIITNILGDARKKTLYEEMLYEFAYFDESTKLANRNMLKKRLDQAIYSRKESGKIAVLDVELENLRMINDTFGHDTGEQIMMKSAIILKNLLDRCCEISRSGEESFVIVLPAVDTTEQIEVFAQRLLDSFSHPISIGTGIEALFVVPRIGISVYPDDGRDADALLKNADLAVYEAKNVNEKIVFYTGRLESHIAENTLFTNRLFKSLQNEEFFLEFQPQISCHTGKTVGAEALLRWMTDGNRIVSPVRFIPILEQTGLIYDVGLWVLEQALQEHNRLVAKGFSPLRFSVNLSVVQFQGESFIPDFTEIIEESGVDPKYIELEITESLFSEDPEDVIKKLYKLKELGVKIAIDDFGKGYSSLNRLKLVPFDRIKIDKEIIDYIDLEKKMAPITEIIILLARAFRAGVTAEGVETKGQADFLRSIDCDEIQGYYFSRPLSPEALEEFLIKESM